MIEQIQNVIYNQVFTNVSMATNPLAFIQPIQGITCYCVQAIWTGWNSDPTATFTISASNDGVNWSQIDQIVPTGASNNFMLNVEKAGYRFVQIVFAQTAGAGTLNCTISGKVI